MPIIAYRGFEIHTRKIPQVPIYYAWVYHVAREKPGFKVSRDDEPLSCERVIELAKWEIDNLLTAEPAAPFCAPPAAPARFSRRPRVTRWQPRIAAACPMLP
jgi:hypothetical protein